MSIDLLLLLGLVALLAIMLGVAAYVSRERRPKPENPVVTEITRQIDASERQDGG